jgi:hypothetical protein
VGATDPTTPRVLAPPRGEPLITLVNPPPLPPRARLFQPAQPPRAYQSVRYAWPPTHTTSESAVPRPFGMDPKPDAERATKANLSPQQAQPYAATGTVTEDAHPTRTSSVTNAPAVETRIMGLKNALERRRSQALSPYKTDAWSNMLNQCNLLAKYPNLLHSLHKGFDAGIQPIYVTTTPANSPTLLQHPEAYHEVVTNKFHRGRYIGPCTRQEVELLIGPFQSSPLS